MKGCQKIYENLKKLAKSDRSKARVQKAVLCKRADGKNTIRCKSLLYCIRAGRNTVEH
jgi:hypothetical protein